MGGGGSGGLAASSDADYTKRLQSVVVSEPCTPHHHSHPPQDQLRHLHKERLHLQHQLEQLDDANSSADEASVPRKRVSDRLNRRTMTSHINFADIVLFWWDFAGTSGGPVSYTHLTLPTKRIV